MTFLGKIKQSKLAQNLQKEKIGSDRSFGWVMLVVCLLLAFFFGGLRPLLVAAAFVLLVLTLWVPHFLHPANRVWTWLGILIGMIVAPVVMVLIFAVSVVPTGLIARLVGKDFLRVRKAPEAKTYWLDRSSSKQSFDQQF